MSPPHPAMVGLFLSLSLSSLSFSLFLSLVLSLSVSFSLFLSHSLHLSLILSISVSRAPSLSPFRPYSSLFTSKEVEFEEKHVCVYLRVSVCLCVCGGR